MTTFVICDEVSGPVGPMLVGYVTDVNNRRFEVITSARNFVDELMQVSIAGETESEVLIEFICEASCGSWRAWVGRDKVVGLNESEYNPKWWAKLRDMLRSAEKISGSDRLTPAYCENLANSTPSAIRSLQLTVSP